MTSRSGGNLADEVPAILAVRDPLYREVAGHIEPTGTSPAAVADRLAALIEGRLAAG